LARIKISAIFARLLSFCQKPIPISLQPDSVNRISNFQTIWSNKIHSLKYKKSTTSGCKDIVMRHSEFVATTQFLSLLVSI